MSIEKRLLPVVKLNLWDHQKDAVREIASYLEAPPKKEAFLVKMPTGTGKTGVFAVLTRIAYTDLNYIIVVPSTALKFQILDELRAAFWEKIGYSAEALPEQFIGEIMPSDIEKILPAIEGKSFILVTTIQALQMLAADNVKSAAYKKLQEGTGCIIFDEGHKEPAYTWGETIRGFEKPTILFSATPYRNDYKIFNVNKDKFYALQHQFCVDKHILRDLVIKKLDADPWNPALFVNALVAEVDKIKTIFQKQGSPEPKVIIRCEKEDDIKKIVAALVKLKKTVIGIHQNFDEAGRFTAQVPALKAQKAYEYFVHQYKLIEGIDNTDFSIVALYSNFASSRMLIQQIGRILRNPAKNPALKGYLFVKDRQKAIEEWEGYLRYDDLLVSGKKLFDVTDVLKVNKDASMLYFSGAFRELIDVNNIDLKESLLFQKKANVFYSHKDVSFDTLCVRILDEWTRRDYSILKQDVVDANVFLVLYIMYTNSPLVKNGIFIEQTLALTYVRYEPDFIFYYDSELNNPLFSMTELEPVASDRLLKLYRHKKGVGKIVLQNTDLGNSALRSKELLAARLEETAPGLADFSFFPSRMEAKVRDGTTGARRYLGMQFGRVTDVMAKRISFEKFQLWIKFVNDELLSKEPSGSIDSFMNRFSVKAEAPDDPQPVNILLDLGLAEFSQYIFGETQATLEWEELCVPINAAHFNIELNGQSFQVHIRYMEEQKKFILSCAELDELVKNIDDEGPGLLALLNQNQQFRIILEGNKYIYAYRNFLKPGLNLISKKKDLDLNQLFHPHTCISTISSEKGKAALKTDGSLWHKDCLFGLVARMAKGYGDADLEKIFGFDCIVCDDLASEIADFIAIDEKEKRVIFIHVKAGKSQLSASAFSEVCSQATKNLEYMTPYFQKDPTNNINRWEGKWSLKNVGEADRLIGGVTARQFWQNYNTMISDASASREVWIVVGNLFDYKKFRTQINKTKIEQVNPEVIQLIYLLRSTWNAVSSVGAQLKIFC